MSIAQLVIVTISMGSAGVPKQMFLFALMLNSLMVGVVVGLISNYAVLFRRVEFGVARWISGKPARKPATQ